MAESIMKWQISFFSLFLFVLVTSSFTYKLTDRLLGGFLGKIADGNGAPTRVGYILHAIVYLLLVRYSMDLNLFRR